MKIFVYYTTNTTVGNCIVDNVEAIQTINDIWKIENEILQSLQLRDEKIERVMLNNIVILPEPTIENFKWN